jgi:hypothetical protein
VTQQSQASSIMVLRRRRLPDFEMP